MARQKDKDKDKDSERPAEKEKDPKKPATMEETLFTSANDGLQNLNGLGDNATWVNKTFGGIFRIGATLLILGVLVTLTVHYKREAKAKGHSSLLSQWFSGDFFSSSEKWDGKIVLTEVGQWSDVVHREKYEDIIWKQLEGSASWFEIRDTNRPSIVYPFAGDIKNATTHGKVHDYQVRIKKGLKNGPVVIGYRKQVN